MHMKNSILKVNCLTFLLKYYILILLKSVDIISLTLYHFQVKVIESVVQVKLLLFALENLGLSKIFILGK